MADKVVLPMGEYNSRQIEEACGPENKWYAGEKLGHPPDHEEAIRHYCEMGGAESFAKRFIPENG